MKFQFNPNQKHQLDAIEAVTGLFKGQKSSQDIFGFSSSQIGKNISNLKGYATGFGNILELNTEQLNKNLKSIQNKNQIISGDHVETQGKNFSVEMETGTGKTYVYLRTILELHKQYSWTKFAIVVPSIAVREGVLKSLEMMRMHFQELYNKTPYSQFVYHSKKTSSLRSFAGNNSLQIMIINIDSFNKDSNIIRLSRDQMGGIKPLEFIQNTHPIVIIDEPQNMESEKSKQAIESLNPLFTLRYSATHRNLYNPIYTLSPVQAFQKKLVKKISVASVVEEQDPTQTYIKVVKIQNVKNKITCTLQFFQSTKEGRKLIKKVCQQHDDLFKFSKENPTYNNGFKVIEISCKPGMEFVRFANSIRLKLGEEQGGYKEDIIKAQIKETLKAHFQKEVQLKNQGIKVLSLFFLDRVENYRLYKNNQAFLGPYGKWFEEIYKELSKEYQKEIEIKPVKEVHNGYFSKDRKGILKNTKGNTKDDEDTYNLIMKDKERLLDIENPLKFIFSHSALREGWDSPNIFQICTLNETSSSLKKRQEIGRGLRLPVNQKGERIQDDLINNLVVVANESYEDFVNHLQKELEDSGFVFGSLPVNAFTDILFKFKGKEYKINQEESKEIWDYFKKSNYISDKGAINKSFYNSVKDGSFTIPEKFHSAMTSITERTEQYQLESHIKKHKNKKKAKLNEKALLDPEFKKFWEAISQKTIYSVKYDTKELIKKASLSIKEMDAIPPIQIVAKQADIELSSKGITAQITKTPDSYAVLEKTTIPDFLSYIEERVRITKQTIFEILNQSGRLDKDFTHNPQKFMDLAVQKITQVLNDLIIEGIQYERLQDSFYEMSRFKKEQNKMEFIDDKIIPTKKSVYDYIYYESGVEKKFAEALENMQNIKYFIKLPSWFKVQTPVGDYNPDWAIFKKNGAIVYMIRETKSTLRSLGLRGLEKAKIKCGKAHFTSIGIDYKECTDIETADL